MLQATNAFKNIGELNVMKLLMYIIYIEAKVFYKVETTMNITHFVYLNELHFLFCSKS